MARGTVSGIRADKLDHLTSYLSALWKGQQKVTIVGNKEGGE